MESAKLSKSELTEIIFYALKENNIDIKEISNHEIETIIIDYKRFCYEFETGYVIGELDTFKRAACLLVAINRRYLSDDRRVNASIALDAAYKMCEKPYWNVGENYDEPKKLEEVDFKKVFENDMYAYEKSKSMLTDSLVYESGSPMNYYLNLELFYQLALVLKHRPIKKNSEVPPVEEKAIQQEELIQQEEKVKPKRRLLGLFKR